jgi:hypothetical protein
MIEAGLAVADQRSSGVTLYVAVRTGGRRHKSNSVIRARYT